MLKHLETVSNNFFGGEILRTQIEVVPRRKNPIENSLAKISALEEMLPKESKRPVYTLPKTNIVPENQRLEDEISCNDGLFLGAMLVSGRVAACFLILHSERNAFNPFCEDVPY